jgi:hypothetical protein
VPNESQLTVIVAEGDWGTVECAVLASERVPAMLFLADLQDKIAARFMVLFDQLAKYGRISPKRFKKEMGRLFAFRHELGKRQIRFPCFQDGNRWILTHGFIKPGAQKGQGDWPRSELDRAENIMGEYFERKKATRNQRGGPQT